MFGAIWRYIRAIGYYMTGRVDAARKVLDTNPHVVRATFAHVVRDKRERVNQYKEAVATLIAQREKKINQVKRLTEDVQKLERLKMGALAKAKQRVSKLQGEGIALDAIQHDEEYIKCQGAFRDFSSTLAEKQGRISELEVDVEAGERRIGEHKVQLQSLLREIEIGQAPADHFDVEIILLLAGSLVRVARQERAVLEAFSPAGIRKSVRPRARVSAGACHSDLR